MPYLIYAPPCISKNHVTWALPTPLSPTEQVILDDIRSWSWHVREFSSNDNPFWLSEKRRHDAITRTEADARLGKKNGRKTLFQVWQSWHGVLILSKDWERRGVTGDVTWGRLVLKDKMGAWKKKYREWKMSTATSSAKVSGDFDDEFPAFVREWGKAIDAAAREVEKGKAEALASSISLNGSVMERLENMYGEDSTKGRQDAGPGIHRNADEM